MTRMKAFGLLAASFALTMTTASRAEDTSDAEPLKVVVHVNMSDPGTQGAGLRNVGNILKEEPTAKVEVVCHAAGIGLVVKTRSDHSDAVATLLKKGVTFVACENTMRQNAIRKDDLLPGASD